MSKKTVRDPQLFAVIMAGGAGRRFWPRSRRNKPKQLLEIRGGPLVQEAASRVLPLVPARRVFISCGADIAARITAAVPEVPKDNLIIEPVGRDTAPCVGLALQHIRKRVKAAHDQAVIAVLPADHFIARPARFRRTLAKAAALARSRGLIVTIGIKPDRPSPAYGYIQPGARLPGKGRAFMVKRFVEKPEPKTAKRYVARGFLWNAGMFVFRLDVMLAAYRRHLPAMAAPLEKIGDALFTKAHGRTLSRVFPRLQKVSIDYGIMEKVDSAAVVEGDFAWCDLGGWEALYRLLGGDGRKNIGRGPVEFAGAEGCYVEAGKLVAVVGVKGLAVIETPDAILVLRMDREADLKKLTDLLEAGGRKNLL